MRKNILIKLISLFTLGVLCSCGSFNSDSKESNKTYVDTTKKVETSESVIIGERIKGPANIYDTIGGHIIFSLNDNVLISCSSLIDEEWYLIGVNMDIDTIEYGSEFLLKGRKIIIDGKKSGEILDKTAISTSSGSHKAFAQLIGYTNKKNIKQNSIIENALSDYLESSKNNRSFKSLNHFIKNFNLKEDSQFNKFRIFYNDESWLEDPSPLFRIVLVFEEEQLVAIVQSREMNIPDTDKYNLIKELSCSIYRDYNNPNEIVEVFNNYLKWVD